MAGARILRVGRLQIWSALAGPCLTIWVLRRLNRWASCSMGEPRTIARTAIGKEASPLRGRGSPRRAGQREDSDDESWDDAAS